ncbi:MAG: gamma-glutamyl kinase [Cenarchaeum sp. SB0662_bin_33]|nr:gamma-glutamyl kinase [Cenarchaeum sp. SB0662_bin_33]
MILIKFGGSVITDKSVPLSFRKETVHVMGEAIRVLSESEPVIIIHGGGSFGHYYSVQYDMHTAPRHYSLDGFSIVRNSMVRLNNLILDVLSQCELRPYCCPPSVLVYSNDAPYHNNNNIPNIHNTIPERVRELQTIAESGMCPVTYGDAMWHGSGMSYILSGDVIMEMLSSILRPRLAVFTLNVDGLYESMETKKVIPRMDTRELADIAIPNNPQQNDVTGGMVRKVSVATEICNGGIDVFFVNGNKPDRITDILRGRYTGTYFSSG